MEQPEFDRVRLLGLAGLIALFVWLSDIRRAEPGSLDNVDSVSTDSAPITIFNDESDARTARISAHGRVRSTRRASSGDRARSLRSRRSPRSEDSRMLEVPQAIDPASADSASDDLTATRHGKDDELQLGAPNPVGGARQSFSGIARAVGTMRDYEQAKDWRTPTVCTASQWWWTLACSPIYPRS